MATFPWSSPCRDHRHMISKRSWVSYKLHTYFRYSGLLQVEVLRIVSIQVMQTISCLPLREPISSDVELAHVPRKIFGSWRCMTHNCLPQSQSINRVISQLIFSFNRDPNLIHTLQYVERRSLWYQTPFHPVEFASELQAPLASNSIVRETPPRNQQGSPTSFRH